MVSDCGPGPACVFGPPTATAVPPLLMYYPAPIPTPLAGNSCPSCTGGASDFQSDIECCNPTPLSCGTQAPPPDNTVTVDTSVYPEGGSVPAREGIQCLIHQQGGGGGQDILNDSVLPGSLNYPLEIQAGNRHPLPALQNKYVSTSDSLVTVPVYEPVPGPPPTSGTPVQVIGFLQLFIIQVFNGGGPKAGEVEAAVVNVSGCGSSATGAPVYGSGVSGIPVRLIQ